jgi:hypothetical protein
MVGRRPIISAKSPAIKAPKKVPALKIETMREVYEDRISVAVAPSTALMKRGAPKTPLI